MRCVALLYQRRRGEQCREISQLDMEQNTSWKCEQQEKTHALRSWQDLCNGSTFHPADTDPLFGHWNQRLDSRLDGGQSLREGCRFPVGRHQQEGSESF